MQKNAFFGAKMCKNCYFLMIFGVFLKFEKLKWWT